LTWGNVARNDTDTHEGALGRVGFDTRSCGV
jgi:hypothetical protein